MRKLELMNRHLFRRFRKVDHLVVAMGHQEEVEIFSILVLQKVSRSIQAHQWEIRIIRDLLSVISNSLVPQPVILRTILDHLQISSGPSHPLDRLVEHTHLEDTVVPHQVTTIHLR